MNKDVLKSLTKQTAADHIVNVIKAAISIYPYGGGLVASLLGDYIPKSRERKNAEFLERLSEDFENFKSRVDENYVKSAGFEFLLIRAWRAAIEHYQQEKIDGFRAILINSVIRKPASEEEKELFVTILDSLTGFHFELLKVLQNPVRWNKANGERVKRSLRPISTRQILQECFPEWKDDYIFIVVNDLYIRKLVELRPEGLDWVQTDRLSLIQPENGIERLKGSLTPFGSRFIDFVTLKNND